MLKAPASVGTLRPSLKLTENFPLVTMGEAAAAWSILLMNEGGDRAVSERVAFIHSAANGCCADSIASAFEVALGEILEVTKNIANGIRLIVTVVRTNGKGVCRECAHSYGSRKQGREHPFYQRVFLLCFFL